MGFLWGLLTFLIVIFSTSQLISYAICYSRYPEMLVGMSDKNKKMIYSGIALHSIINIAWLIIVCAVPQVRASWVVILIVAIVSIVISIIGIRDDDKMKNNFAQLTGYAERRHIELEVDKLIKTKQAELSSKKELNNTNDIKKDNSQVAKTSKAKAESERVKNEILESLENWEPTYEEAKELSERKKKHTIDNLTDYMLKMREDINAGKDVAETLTNMYGDDTEVYIGMKGEVIKPAIVIDNDEVEHKYLVIYTDNSFIDEGYANHNEKMGTQKAFGCFYLAWGLKLVEGIIFNPKTKFTTVLTKEAFDAMHLELIYDVPWKDLI